MKTESEKIKLLRDFLKVDAFCPCCEQYCECLEGCTFAVDAPNEFEEMNAVRKILEETK